MPECMMMANEASTDLGRKAVDSLGWPFSEMVRKRFVDGPSHPAPSRLLHRPILALPVAIVTATPADTSQAPPRHSGAILRPRLLDRLPARLWPHPDVPS